MTESTTYLRCTILTGREKPCRGRYYLLTSNSIYRYTYGCNWRAITAFVVGIAPNLPGFINSINPKINPGVGTHPYTFAWLLGFAITSLIFVLLSTIFPPRETMSSCAVLPDEVYQSGGHDAVAIEGQGFDEDLESHNIGEASWMKDPDQLRVV